VIRAAQADDIASPRLLFCEYAGWVGDRIGFPALERETAELRSPGISAMPVWGDR
jgi:hypothetical protein